MRVNRQSVHRVTIGLHIESNPEKLISTLKIRHQPWTTYDGYYLIKTTTY